MRIKRSHLDSLHFVIGTTLSCFLVLAVSSNLQAHPLAGILKAAPHSANRTSETTQTSKSDSASAQVGVESTSICVLGPTSREIDRSEPLVAELRQALTPFSQPLTESIETVMIDDCAKTAVSTISELAPSEKIEALLETVNAAVNFEPSVRSCDASVTMTLASL